MNENIRQNQPQPSNSTGPGPNTTNVSIDDKSLAALAHVLGAFTSFVGPLIIWILQKDKGSLAEKNAKEALNFQITIAICLIIATMLVFVLVGFLLIPVISIIDVVFSVIAAIDVNNGKEYKYPLCFRLIN